MWNINLHLLFSFGTLATAAVLDRRQDIFTVGPDGKKQTFGYNFDMDLLTPPMKALEVVDAKSRLRPSSIRKVTKFGPLILPPMKDGVKVGNHTHGSSSQGPSSEPKTLADILPGTPAITWDDVAKSYRQSALGDYEGAMSTLLHVPQDQGGNIYLRSLKGGFCSDCTVLAVKTDLVNEDGSRVDISNGVYVHHAVSFNMAWREMANWINLCPLESKPMKDIELFSYLPSNLPTPFTMFGNAAVDEFQQRYASPEKGAPESGYYLGTHDYFMMQAEMINYTKDQKKVYIKFDYEYLKGRAGKESTMALISQTGCFDGLGFFGNGTSGKIRSQEYKILQDGAIVVARGHLHDGGESMTVLLNEKPVCISKAIYGTKLKNEDGKEWTTISEMTECVEPVPVKKGDKIVLETKFDEISHPPRESQGRKQEEMGVMQFTFVPT